MTKRLLFDLFYYPLLIGFAVYVLGDMLFGAWHRNYTVSMTLAVVNLVMGIASLIWTFKDPVARLPREDPPQA